MPPRSPSIRYSPSDLADLDENFPPSISQRHPPRSPLRHTQTIDMRGYTHRSVSGGSARTRDEAQGSASPSSAVRSGQDSPRRGEASRNTGQRSGPGAGAGALLLPNQGEPRVLKQKRSFERTKAWAAGLDASEMVDSEGAGSLTSDDASHGSESIMTPRTPRSPSPASDRAILPTIIAPDPLPADPPSPPRILSIDELVRLHSAGISQPMAAARDKARKELGMGPSPVPSRNGTPLLLPEPLKLVPLADADEDSDDPDAEAPTGRGGRDLLGVGPPPSPRSPRSPTIPVRATSLSTPRQAPQPIRAVSSPLPHRPVSPVSATSGRDARSGRESGTTSPAPSPLPIPIPEPPSDAAHELALHLRSEQLNKFFIFPRPFPHRPLRVSYAEVGKPDGYPVFFFLGLGCVRYLIALYDEFAQAFGLRVICVDRWGYGKTDQVDQLDRGLVEWSTVMGQVCKELKIEKCQIVAHSCGAPYALAMARRWPEMVRGKVHLMAPWVGQEHENVSKWLKWVPGSVIKTATRADHRLHSFFIGKAPKLGFKPVAFDKSKIAAVAAKSSVTPSTHTQGEDERDDADVRSVRSRISSKAGKRPSRINIREPIKSSTSQGDTKSPTGSSFKHRAGSAFMRGPSSIYGSIGAASAVSLALPQAQSRPSDVGDVNSYSDAASPPQSPVFVSTGRGGWGNKLPTPKTTPKAPRKSLSANSDSRPTLHLGRSPAVQDLRSFSASSSHLPAREAAGLGLGLAPPLPLGASTTAVSINSQITDSLGMLSTSGSTGRTPKTSALRAGSRSRSGPIARSDLLGSVEEADGYGIGGFASMATDLQLALPPPGLPNKASTSSLPPYLRNLDECNQPRLPSGPSSSQSQSTVYPSTSLPSTSSHPLSMPISISDHNPTSSRFIQHNLPFHPNLPTAETESRYPSTPAFALALEQASHAECEPGTTSDIIRVIVNRPYRSFGFLYENIPFKTHVWWGTDDKMISEKSVKWMKEKCGSEVTVKKGVAHGMLSDPGVVGELFSALGEEARGNWS